MEQNYYQREIETMSAEEMKKLQSEKLVKQVKHVYENVPYYRNLMDENGVCPEDIRGIEDLSDDPVIGRYDGEVVPATDLGIPMENSRIGIHVMSQDPVPYKSLTEGSVHEDQGHGTLWCFIRVLRSPWLPRHTQCIRHR